MVRQVVSLAFSCIGLLGCADQSDEVVSADRYRPEWRVLDDGSNFAIVPQADIDDPVPDSETAVRCWADGENEQICLFAYELRDAINLLSISVQRVPELPSIIFAPSEGGYTCRAMMGTATEEIRRGQSALTTNRLDYGSGQWGRSFVSRYMRDNDVEGEWFDCIGVLRAVNAGSLETLSTTDIRRSMLPD